MTVAKSKTSLQNWRG